MHSLLMALKHLLAGAAAGLIGSVAAAQSTASPTLVSADMRPSIDLDGAWTWSTDQYRTGLRNFHGAAPSPAARRYSDFDVTKAMRSDPKALYEFDMDRAPAVHLPQSFLTYSPEMRHYNGLVWHQRRFVAHPPRSERAFLRFGATLGRDSTEILQQLDRPKPEQSLPKILNRSQVNQLISAPSP